jgi:lysophospholipase L1-like esterase/dienelactone hydrolase
MYNHLNIHEMKKMLYLLYAMFLFACLSVCNGATAQIKVACAGASITEGGYLPDATANAYPGQLQALLGAGYTVENFGAPGSTLLKKGNFPYWKTQAYQKALGSAPDIVFIDLGGNDAKAVNRPFYDELEQDCRDMIRTFRELPSHPRVIVVLPTAFFVTDSAGIFDPVSRNQVTPRLQKAAFEENVETIDMHPLLIDRPDLIPDGIHPNREGSEIMAKRMFRQIAVAEDASFDIFSALDKAGIAYQTSNYAGYRCATFLFNGRESKVVKPKKTAAGHPWIWHVRFFGHEPQTEIALLERGYHLVYNDQAERMGNRQNIDDWNAFYKLLHEGGLSRKAVLEGMSRGGVYAFNWAAANPDKVAAVYVDNPLLDMKAMYYGPDGKEKPENEITQGIRENWGIDRRQIEQFNESPIDKTDDIVKGRYPILILCAELDEAAVNTQNAFPFEKKIREKGGDITVIEKKGFRHHPHSFPNPAVIVDFIEKAVMKEASLFPDKRIVANPMNLNYRFQPADPSRREAADPVLEYFKGKYYLFASKSGGYWSSPDLANWTYIPCQTIETIENYAPAILILDDELYYMGSGEDCKIYKTGNPDADDWRLIDSKFRFPLVGNVDPAFFQDDDNRVYIYWGCSDKDPIIGVEVDPNDGFNVVGEASVLIEHRSKEYGWEVKGPDNQSDKDGYNEGPCIIKHKGTYYLQYAAPGTEFRNYGDGMYVSGAPLGPYVYEASSPFSFKPGGFIGGAGHGHTFRDKYGNLWHVATMKLSQRHMFERRLGLFPAYFSSDDVLHAHTVRTDYPYFIPEGKIDFETNDLSMNWNLLSCHKSVEASSALPGYEAEKAGDEQVETWWSAKTGKMGEWWKIDLGKPMRINAVQVNFADQDFTLKSNDSYINYQYTIDYSDDGINWQLLADRSDNIKDSPHDFIVPDKPADARYLRITNKKNLDGKFSLYDFRVFGHGNGSLPQQVSGFAAKRKDDRRRFDFTWDKAEHATGYIIRWGVKKDELKNTTMIMGDHFLEAGYFNRDSDYFFAIDSFNENGVTKGTTIIQSRE